MPNTLTKADIIEAIQKENGYSRNQSSEVTEILLAIIKQSLESGEDVMISGFGKLQVKTKKERQGRNPATGSSIPSIFLVHLSLKFRHRQYQLQDLHQMIEKVKKPVIPSGKFRKDSCFGSNEVSNASSLEGRN